MTEKIAAFGLTEDELNLARICATEAVENYGSDDGPTHQRILRDGIWNDHVAVQAAINVIKTIKVASQIFKVCEESRERNNKNND